MGVGALYNNTTGTYNSAMGVGALYNNNDWGNSAVGYHALRYNTTGSYNSAMGYETLTKNTAGNGNSAMGSNALEHNTTGNRNSAMGVGALYNNTTGNHNSALGSSALNKNTTGNYNVGIGYWANYYNEEGSRNTIIGYQAGQGGSSLHSKSGNVFIGYQAGYHETSNDKLYIDNSSASTPLIHGDFSLNRVGINRKSTANTLEVGGNASKSTAGSWLANSDARIKTDIKNVTNALGTLDKVRLVSFKYTDDYRCQHQGVEDRTYLNVVAQEFAEVFPDYVKSSGEKLSHGQEILQVDTYPLTIYTAAAVQELHENVNELKAENELLKQRLEAQEKALQQLQTIIVKGALQ
jgi:hypothetical protein